MVTPVSHQPSWTAILDVLPPSCLSKEHERIDALFQRELHLRPLHIERISKGWTNSSYKVQTERGAYFFREGTDRPEILGISREKEAFAYKLISSEEISPTPLYLDPMRGILITPFIEGATPYGKVLGIWTGNREEVIDHIVQLMRRIHAKTPQEQVPINHPFAIIEKYFAECQKAGVALPGDIEQALEIVDTVKKEPLRIDRAVLCHHDFFWDNLLFDGKNLQIVDWEYAGWDDPFYDLAGFCVAHRLLDKEERNLLLKAYFTTFGEEEQRKLAAMCMLYSLKNALWAYLQEMLRPDLPEYIHSIADMHYATFWEFHRDF